MWRNAKKLNFISLICLSALAFESCVVYGYGNGLAFPKFTLGFVVNNHKISQRSSKLSYNSGVKRNKQLQMLTPTQAEVDTVAKAAIKAITSNSEAKAKFGSGIKIMNYIATGKPKEGCVNIRFNARGTATNKNGRGNAQGQVTAQTEGGKLVRCWVDLDAGW
eukprot:CAMPEP_0117746660 /NCGR_PEP_ID=MMETSP0947-20121206/8072_1 /TAXON_ID=44440 /ORGANISM="Chattonella subsalsa, Strain CCMP2191" /LENGTH=162 /DNA_ID=CAMNT_0005564013 /DNA_START=109 /DNA_END=594 /DNA_ORIENTATION=+